MEKPPRSESVREIGSQRAASQIREAAAGDVPEVVGDKGSGLDLSASTDAPDSLRLLPNSGSALNLGAGEGKTDGNVHGQPPFPALIRIAIDC